MARIVGDLSWAKVQIRLPAPNGSTNYLAHYGFRSRFAGTAGQKTDVGISDINVNEDYKTLIIGANNIKPPRASFRVEHGYASSFISYNKIGRAIAQNGARITKGKYDLVPTTVLGSDRAAFSVLCCVPVFRTIAADTANYKIYYLWTMSRELLYRTANGTLTPLLSTPLPVFLMNYIHDFKVINKMSDFDNDGIYIMGATYPKPAFRMKFLYYEENTGDLLTISTFSPEYEPKTNPPSQIGNRFVYAGYEAILTKESYGPPGLAYVLAKGRMAETVEGDFNEYLTHYLSGLVPTQQGQRP